MTSTRPRKRPPGITQIMPGRQVQPKSIRACEQLWSRPRDSLAPNLSPYEAPSGRSMVKLTSPTSSQMSHGDRMKSKIRGDILFQPMEWVLAIISVLLLLAAGLVFLPVLWLVASRMRLKPAAMIKLNRTPETRVLETDQFSEPDATIDGANRLIRHRRDGNQSGQSHQRVA